MISNLNFSTSQLPIGRRHCRSVCLSSCDGVRPNRACRPCRLVSVCLSACDEVRANLACPRAEGRLALRRAPLDNRKIAFGCGRQAIRRLCARPLSWRARSSSRWHVCGLGSAAVVAPPPRIAFDPVRGIHPRMRLAWLGRNTSRHPARPPRGACRTRAADSLWPRSSLASPRPLIAPAPSRGARLLAARLMPPSAAVEELRR